MAELAFTTGSAAAFMKKYLPRICGLGTLTILWMAASVHAGEENYTGNDWNLLNVSNVLATAADITPEKFPNCDETTVDGKMIRAYHPDGTAECQDETFIKVLTEKGRREHRTLSFFFMLPYWTVEVTKLEVLKPDGTRVPVDVAANSKESIDDSQMEMNIYDPNDRILRVNIPQLDIGDVVHVITRLTIHRSIMPDEYDESNVFEETGYIRHLAYEIHAPTNLPLQRIAVRDEVAGTISASTKTNGETVVYHWEINQVPRMFDEPEMPPYDQVLQRLFVSTIPTWEDISKWYWNLSLPHLEKFTPEMQQTNAILIANQPTDLDKVKAIFYFVSKNIRYMGLTPEKDRPGFEPHDVCVTFDKKYGVCRDKAGLLVEMLRLAGFKAYPVLINIGAKRDLTVPQPAFNHAIVCVELKPGEYTLMDPTDENTRDLLPSYDGNRSYLVCKPEGETLLVSPVSPAENHMLTVKTTGTLNAGGTLEATSEMSFTGVNDDAYRNRLAHLKLDEARRFFEERLKEAIPGARLAAFKLTPENVLDVSQPLHVELKYTADGLTANGGGKSVVGLPWASSSLGIANRILTGATGLEKRKYPLDLGVACGVREDISLKLADDFTAPLAIPSFSSTHGDGLDYSQTVTFTNNWLNCSREFKLTSPEFSPAQYLQLRQMLKNMDYDRRKNVIMALNTEKSDATAKTSRAPETAVDSNAKILTSEKTLTVKDAHTAVYRVQYSKRILTYGGKIREAEVKIPYNPACEEVKLIHAVVISKTGQRQEISPDEINVMDQGWNATAKRYTGGKILVANLPGVEIGSTIEVAYEVTMHDELFLSDFEPFQFPDALESKTFTLTAPKDVAIQKIISGGKIVSETRKTADDITTFNWQATNVEALPAEPQLPPLWNYNAGVSYFIGKTADYWKSLHEAMLAHAQNSTNAAKLARQLANGKTPLEAAKAIRDFIAQNILVAGPSFTELPLRELSDADTTLADGYGHAADCAILFYAMLSAAGFQPEFVMASELPPVDGIKRIAKSFPLPDDFQTPLVKISANGSDYYFNDGDQYAQLGTTASDGKLGVTLANGKMQTIQAAENCSDKTETDYAVSLSEDGRARIKISTRYYGDAYNMNHRYFAELPPEEREHYFQGLVSRIAQGARPVGNLTTRFDSYPGLQEFTVDLDHFAVADGKYLYFNLPFTPSFFTGTDQRTLPLFISNENEKVIHTEIQLPAGFHPAGIAPRNEKLAAPGGSWIRNVKSGKDDKFTLTDELETLPAVVSPKDYPTLLNIQSTLGRKSATLFLLERQ